MTLTLWPRSPAPASCHRVPANTRHAESPNTRWPPPGFLESRTPTAVLTSATSTQAPLLPLRLLFRHTAEEKFTEDTVCLSFAIQLVRHLLDESHRIRRAQCLGPQAVELKPSLCHLLGVLNLQ
jgi:hypothetical protein